MLIEAVWSYRLPTRVSREQLPRQEGLVRPIRDAAWKAQERLCRRYRKLAGTGKSPAMITTAIAQKMAASAGQNLAFGSKVKCVFRRLQEPLT
jgi:transposase